MAKKNTAGNLFILLLLVIGCPGLILLCGRPHSNGTGDFSDVQIGMRGADVVRLLGRPTSEQHEEDEQGYTNTWHYGTVTIYLRNSHVERIEQ